MTPAARGSQTRTPRPLVAALLVSLAAWGLAAWRDHRRLTAGQPIAWTTFEEATERARTEGRHVLVDFSAEWCGPCRSMDRVVFADERVRAAVRECCVAARVDVDEEASPPGRTPGDAIAKERNVKSLPTLLVLDARGQPLARWEGYRDADSLLDALAALPPTTGTPPASGPPVR